MSGYCGRQIVGIDLHRRRSVLVRMTPEGEVLGKARIDNDPQVFAEQIALMGEAPEVVLEATYGWYWAADLLADNGARVHLAHPLGVKGFSYRRVKNDERDAADLADLLRMGRLPEAWVAPPSVRELRELVRHRAKLVSLRTGLKCSVHAVLAKCGVAVPMSDLFGVAGEKMLTRLRLAPVSGSYRQPAPADPRIRQGDRPGGQGHRLPGGPDTWLESCSGPRRGRADAGGGPGGRDR